MSLDYQYVCFVVSDDVVVVVADVVFLLRILVLYIEDERVSFFVYSTHDDFLSIGLYCSSLSSGH